MDSKKNKMSEEEKYRLHNLCFESKLGQRLSREDQQWLEKMFNLYTEEYGTIQRGAAIAAMKTINPLYDVEEE